VRVIDESKKPAVMLNEKATADYGKIVYVDFFAKRKRDKRNFISLRFTPTRL